MPETGLCLICNDAKATKKNSHIIPSFLIAKACSYDGSGMRGKEVLFTVSGSHNSVYLGQLPDIEIEQVLDSKRLSSERIEKELKINPLSQDYVFCPQCEKRLADYLESPYSVHFSRGREICKEIEYFFWVSVIWRVSVSRLYNSKLPKDIEDNLGSSLYKYLEARTSGEDTEAVTSECCLSYSLLRCPSFSTDGSGLFFDAFDSEHNLFTGTFGEIVVCAQFDRSARTLPDGYRFYGLESFLALAPINNGQDEERYLEIDESGLSDAFERILKVIASSRVEFEKGFAIDLWQTLEIPGEMPEIIVKEYLSAMYNDDSKPGELTDRTRRHIFVSILVSRGIIIP